MLVGEDRIAQRIPGCYDLLLCRASRWRWCVFYLLVVRVLDGHLRGYVNPTQTLGVKPTLGHRQSLALDLRFFRTDLPNISTSKSPIHS